MVADQRSTDAPQNAVRIELCLRLTNGKLALAHWIARGDAQIGYMESARSIARRHEMDSVVVAARNGGLPKR